VAAVLAAAVPGRANEDDEPHLPVDVTLPDSPHPRVQWTLTLDVGGGLATRETDPRRLEGIFHLAAHSLMLFGRRNPPDWGFGLCFDTGSWDMEALTTGAGWAFLVPFAGYLPLVVETWPYYLYRGGHGWGFTVRAWWGLHALNYLRSHVTTVGLYVQASRSFAVREAERWVVTAGLDLSLVFPLLPFVAAASAVKK
jgi:hypothetical protein